MLQKRRTTSVRVFISAQDTRIMNECAVRNIFSCMESERSFVFDARTQCVRREGNWRRDAVFEFGAAGAHFELGDVNVRTPTSGQAAGGTRIHTRDAGTVRNWRRVRAARGRFANSPLECAERSLAAPCVSRADRRAHSSARWCPRSVCVRVGSGDSINSRLRRGVKIFSHVDSRSRHGPVSASHCIPIGREQVLRRAAPCVLLSPTFHRTQGWGAPNATASAPMDLWRRSRADRFANCEEGLRCAPRRP